MNGNFLRKLWDGADYLKIVPIRIFKYEIKLFFNIKRKCFILDIILFCVIVVTFITGMLISFSGEIFLDAYNREKQAKAYIRNQLELLGEPSEKIKLYTSEDNYCADRIEVFCVYLVQDKNHKYKCKINWVEIKMPERNFIVTKFEKEN